MKSDKKPKKEKIVRNDRVTFLHFLKFQMSLLTAGAVIIAVVIILALVIPEAKSTLLDQTKNYLHDVTVSNGATLEMMRKQVKLKDPEALKDSFQNVGLDGIDSSYAYVVTADGTMQYHPTADKIGKPVENALIKDVVAQMAQGKRPEAKVASYDFNGVQKYAAYYVDEARSSVLVVSADQSEILAPLNKVTYISIGVSVAVIIIMMIVSLILITASLRPISKISAIVGKMSRMDFTPTPGSEKLVSHKDETGVMSRSVAELRRELVAMVEERSGRRARNFSGHLIVWIRMRPAQPRPFPRWKVQWETLHPEPPVRHRRHRVLRSM